jgi:hypothetical protein
MRTETRAAELPRSILAVPKATHGRPDLGGRAGQRENARQPDTMMIARGLERLAVWTHRRAGLDAER